MPSRVLTPGTATNVIGTWNNPSNALVLDDVQATLANGAPPATLALTAMDDRSLPAGFVVSGFEITFVTGPFHPFIFPDDGKIEVALTKDGGFTPSSVVLSAVNTGTIIFGGPTELWGETWSLSDVASAGFGAIVRRPSDYPTGIRSVDAVTVTVYYVVEGSSLMANRPTSLQRCLIGKESSAGTAQDPTIELKSIRVTPQPDVVTKDIVHVGSLVAGDTVKVSRATALSVDGHPDYNELGYILASLVGKPSTSTIASGVYRHEFNFDPKGKADPRSYTLEWGDDSNAERCLYSILTALGLTLNRQDTTVNGSGFARGQDWQGGVTAGADCVQTITVTGSPAGGTFTLRWQGQTTGNLNYNDAAAAIQSALEGLSNIGAGNIAVSGSGPFTATFGGTLGGVKQPLIELDDNSLTGGTSPSVTIDMTTEGGQTLWPKSPMSVLDINVYYAATLAGIAAGKLGDCYETRWNLQSRFGKRTVVDSTSDTFKDIVETPVDWMVGLDIEANSAADTIEGDLAGDTKYLRIEATSSREVASGNPFKLTLDSAVQLRGVGGYSDHEGDYARSFDFKVVFDQSWGRAAQIVLINGVDAY